MNKDLACTETPGSLLGWTELCWHEDAAVHLANQRNGICDAIVPSGNGPGLLANFLALLERFVAPDVMDVVKSTDLREETAVSLMALLSVVDRTSPIVAPLNHRARLQSVRSHFIDVVALSWFNQWPIAERQQILQVSISQQRSTISRQRDIAGISAERLLGQVDHLEAASVAIEMHKLIHVADLHRPRADQLARDIVLLRLDDLHGVFVIFNVFLPRVGTNVVRMQRIDDFFI